MPATLSPLIVEDFVPVIDLSVSRTSAGNRAALAAVIDAVCSESGFLVITGHGVPDDLTQRMDAVTRAFFAMPTEVKNRCSSPHSGRGFKDGGFVAASYGKATPPDLCESFSISHLGEPGVADRRHFGEHLDEWNFPNVWPETPTAFRATWLEYYDAMEDLAHELMRLFAMGLGLGERYFEDKIDHDISKLYANYYYPQLEAALPGQLRKGEHTDWGSLTILYQDGADGLQVMQEGYGWRDVPAIPGTFVVNLGDLMQTWTGGRWASTIHRVINPREGHNEERLSIPFFHQPNFDAVIRPLPFVADADAFEPITSGAWLAAKAQAAITGISI